MAGVPPREVPNGTRSGRLLLAFQEPLTAVLKVQSVNNADFRAAMVKALEKSVEQGQFAGYDGEDVKLAEFAVVAFLDEAVLNSRNPRLSGWATLQSERLGTTDAGKIFFLNLERIRARGNSPDVADLLEVYALCLLLGFRGQFRVIGESGLPELVALITRKIVHIRKDLPVRKEIWRLPDEVRSPVYVDRSIRRLMWAVVACLVLTVALWTGFKIFLGREMNKVRESTAQLGR